MCLFAQKSIGYKRIKIIICLIVFVLLFVYRNMFVFLFLLLWLSFYFIELKFPFLCIWTLCLVTCVVFSNLQNVLEFIAFRVPHPLFLRLAAPYQQRSQPRSPNCREGLAAMDRLWNPSRFELSFLVLNLRSLHHAPTFETRHNWRVNVPYHQTFVLGLKEM